MFLYGTPVSCAFLFSLEYSTGSSSSSKASPEGCWGAGAPSDKGNDSCLLTETKAGDAVRGLDCGGCLVVLPVSMSTQGPPSAPPRAAALRFAANNLPKRPSEAFAGGGV